MLILGSLFIIWIIIGASVAVSHLLAKWSRRASLRQSRDLPPVPKRAITILAIALSVYGTVAFIAYAFWCDSVRNVDIGIGDSWAAPVGNDYYFCMVDSTEDGDLVQGSCFMDLSGNFDNRLVSNNITDLGQEGEKVIGKQESGAFILDTGSGKLQHYTDIHAALQDFSPSPSMHSAYGFYMRNRWGLLDLVAFGLIGIPAVAFIVVWYKFQIIGSKKKQAPHEGADGG